jgi:hypothetical protein
MLKEAKTSSRQDLSIHIEDDLIFFNLISYINFFLFVDRQIDAAPPRRFEMQDKGTSKPISAI